VKRVKNRVLPVLRPLLSSPQLLQANIFIFKHLQKWLKENSTRSWFNFQFGFSELLWIAGIDDEGELIKKQGLRSWFLKGKE
jgi:hypothetical protein